MSRHHNGLHLNRYLAREGIGKHQRYIDFLTTLQQRESGLFDVTPHLIPSWATTIFPFANTWHTTHTRAGP